MIKALKRKPAVDSVRARRYPIRLPVRYRASDGHWREGHTRNMSRSGVLLHTDAALTPESSIELIVELPPVLPGEVPPHVVCRGRIVRTVSRDATGATVAATFTHYTFGRSDDLPAASET